MVYELGYHLSDEELKMALLVLDSDGDKLISYAEFSKWWRTEDRFKQLQRSEAELETLHQCANEFQMFDEDGSCTLYPDEFAKLHVQLVATEMTTLSAEHLLANLDVDGDGLISFNEYVAWIISSGTIRKPPALVQIPVTEAPTATPTTPTTPIAPTPTPIAPTPTPLNIQASQRAQHAAEMAEAIRQRRLRIAAGTN